jgi:hypothetical protein
VITIDALRTVLDSIAAGVNVFDVGVGEGTPGTVSGGADDNAAFLRGLNDAAVTHDMVGAFDTRAATVRASSLHRSLGGPLIQRALDRHFGATFGSLSAFLRQHDTRVHENLLAIGLTLDADVVFSQTPTELGGWLDGGFTDGGAIDKGQRADAPIELVVDAKGPTPAMVHLQVRDRTGKDTVAAVNVPGDTPAGTVLPLQAGERFADLIAITIADGGDADDAYRVRTVVERNVVL